MGVTAVATMKDVAKAAGVSVATVSRVLNDDDRVAGETRARVQQVIEQLGYTPNTLGRNLRLAATHRVLVLVSSLSNQFCSGVVRGMEMKAAENGYQVMLAATHQDPELERRFLQSLYNRSVDGMVLMGARLPAEELSAIGKNYPLVLCCERVEGARVPCVSIDDELAGYDAVHMLVQKGHRRIAILSNREIASARKRTAGYERALREAGVQPETDLMVERYEYSSAAGMEACEKLFSLSEPPTAIFCISDDLAAGVCRVLREKGLTPGRDVDVVGFDNTPISRVFVPDITTISQPRRELGRQAMQQLLLRMEGAPCERRDVYLPHQLVLRESTGIRTEK